MSYYKFEEDDIFVNTIEAYPEYRVYIHSGTVWLDDIPNMASANTNNILCVPDGHVSLYEYNIDRTENYIHPFIIKDGPRDSFKKVKKLTYNTRYGYSGSTVASAYNMSASISRDYYSTTSRARLGALKNTLNHYTYRSPHYQYSSSHGDKATQNVNLISIPSIMYGSSIKEGSVILRYYITGTLMGELSDHRMNGELVQVGPPGSEGSGSVAGVVLYNEGFVVLTGSWSLNPDSILYDTSGPSTWLTYGYGVKNSSGDVPTIGPGITTTPSASFLMEYSGTTHIQTLTMLAHAKHGELNHSNNPTYTSASYRNLPHYSGNYTFVEKPRYLKNVVYSQFTDEKPEFKKVVYISKIGLYDENKNLIGIAKVATPVRKTDDHSYTFKLKLDI